MFPKLSAPLVKDIRTGEGIFEWVLATAGGLAAVTGNASYSHTGVYLAILAGIKGARRGLVKAIAIQKGLGIGAPIQPGLPELGQALVSDAAELASQPPPEVAP